MEDVKTSLATTISMGVVLAAGSVAFAVNTSVLDATVTADQAPAGSARLVDEPATTGTSAAAPATTVVPPDDAAVAQAAATTLPQATQSAYDVQGFGIVTLEQTASSLTVVSVAAAANVTAQAGQESATRVEVRFADASGQSVTFHADVIGGRIVTSVMREPADGRRGNARPPRDDDHHGHHDDREGDDGHEEYEEEDDDD